MDSLHTHDDHNRPRNFFDQIVHIVFTTSYILNMINLSLVAIVC